MTRTRSYRNGSLARESFPLAEVSDELADQRNVVWVDLCGPSESDLAAVGEELGLHALAIEDAVQRNQRPKVDRYQGHLFIAMYRVELDTSTGELSSSELAVFVTDRAVVTVRRPDGVDIDEALRRWDESELTPDSVGALLHGLLDLVVDSHLDAVRTLDEELDAVEGQLFDDSPSTDLVGRRAARLRRSVSTLRRIALPMRDIVTGLLRHPTELVDEHLAPYFHDILDHAVHTESWLDSLRDLAATIRETELSLQGNRLNVIMKKVTGWAAVIAVPTAVTGFYGQNLPYPGYLRPWGFWTSTLVISVLSVGLYVYLRRRDWI